MTDKIKEKVSKFLELSFKFSKSEYDLFLETNSSHLTNGSICFSGHEGSSPPRTERIKKANRELEKLSEEFDEFMPLRNDLNNYFNAEYNLNK